MNKIFQYRNKEQSNRFMERLNYIQCLIEDIQVAGYDPHISFSDNFDRLDILDDSVEFSWEHIDTWDDYSGSSYLKIPRYLFENGTDKEIIQYYKAQEDREEKRNWEGHAIMLIQHLMSDKQIVDMINKKGYPVDCNYNTVKKWLYEGEDNE